MSQFLLPDPGEGLTDATIVEWLVAAGDTVAVDQPLVEIETAKSLVELPSPAAGRISRLLAPAGAVLPVGAPLLEFDDDAAGPVPAPAAQADSGVPDAAAQDTRPEPVLVGYGAAAVTTPRRRLRPPATGPHEAAPTTGPGAPSSVRAKPPVRKLARELGVDLAAVRPTGPGGIVTRDDVVDFAAQAALPDALDEPWLAGGRVSADGRTTRVPVKAVRRRTAEAMVASAFSAPHVTVFHTVDVTRSMELLARLKQDREFADLRLTPLLLAMKALLLAVARHPEINASWDEDAQQIVYKHYVNLGIAASTPRGLLVPNIKDAHRMSLKELAAALAELTQQARLGTTPPAAMVDGTITLTNVGVFGIDTGTPILNPGEAAILAFGAIRPQPWVVDGAVVPRHVTQLALSFDHRLVDGELGSRVLADVARVLEDPGQALVWG